LLNKNILNKLQKKSFLSDKPDIIF